MKKDLIFITGGLICISVLSTAAAYFTASVCEDIRNNIKSKKFKKKLEALKQEQES